MMKHRVCAVKLLLEPVRVEATERFLLRRGDGGRAVGAHARCAQNGRLPGDTDAAHGHAGVAANLPTRRSALAGHEALKNVMSLVDDHGQSLNRLFLTV